MPEFLQLTQLRSTVDNVNAKCQDTFHVTITIVGTTIYSCVNLQNQSLRNWDVHNAFIDHHSVTRLCYVSIHITVVVL